MQLRLDLPRRFYGRLVRIAVDVYVRAEGVAIKDYVVEDHKDDVPGTFETQKEAID